MVRVTKLVTYLALVGAAIAVPAIHQRAPEPDATVLSLLVTGMAVALGAMFAPIAAAVFITYVATTAGGPPILIAAPAVIWLAARSAHQAGGFGNGRLPTRRTAMFVLVALVLTLPFVNVATLGFSSSRSQGQRAQSVQIGAGSDDSLIRRIIAYVFGDGGENNDGTISVGATPPEANSSFPWQLLLVIGIVTIVASAIAYLAWRWWRRDRRGATAIPAASLQRLESTGRRVGRPRLRHEGALSFSRAVGVHTGDHRLAAAGELVSGEIYSSPSSDERQVDVALAHIETAPPKRPPRLRLQKLGTSLRKLVPKTRRAWTQLAIAGVFVSAAIVMILPRLDSLSSTAPVGAPAPLLALLDAPHQQTSHHQV